MDIDRKNIERFPLDDPEGFPAVRRGDYLVLVLSQEGGQLFPERRIVVRDEELHETPFGIPDDDPLARIKDYRRDFRFRQQMGTRCLASPGLLRRSRDGPRDLEAAVLEGEGIVPGLVFRRAHLHDPEAPLDKEV